MTSARQWRLGVAVALFLVPLAGRAAVITVNGTGDNTTVDGVCTLTEAINAANSNSTNGDCVAGDPGLDTIAFNIGGGGVQTIAVAFSLPFLTEPANIDGTTQPGFSGTPLIILNGQPLKLLGATAIRILETAGGSTVRSLAIGGFDFAIFIQSSNNLVVGNYLGLDEIGRASCRERV